MRLSEFRLEGLDDLTKLIWPDFVEVNDCVVRADRYQPGNFDGWWTSNSDTPWVIETLLSEEHFYDLVNDYTEDQLEQLEAVARRVAECWRVALGHRFPDRRFTVTFVTEPDSYGPTISFHQSTRCPTCIAEAGPAT
jgi:hypothetical protein